MTETIPTIPVASDHLRRHANQALDHLPGPAGHWLLGNVRQLGSNPLPYLTQLRRQHGDCFTIGFLRNRRVLMLLGPGANELVLLDRDNNFSSHWGWEVVHAFFGRNILVRDFDDHRAHRKLMTHLFKTRALAAYLTQMREPVTRAVEDLSGTVDVYRETKRLALDIAIRVFAGISTDLSDWNEDLSIVLANVMAYRIRLPGTRYAKALAARDRLRTRLRREIVNRRGSHGDDLFSQLVNNQDEVGRRLSDQDVVDHMFGLLFAAHDTTASALAMMCLLLAEHTDLQNRAREECRHLQARTGSLDLRHEDLDQLTFIESLFRETLRMYAPIQFLPRRSVRGFVFENHRIPANTAIMLAPQVTHFDENHFPRAGRFDPDRFVHTQPHPFAFVPFGKGSHMCLGMHFAQMEIKAVLYRLLLTRRWEMSERVSLELQYLPVVRPVNGTRVSFERLAAA